MRLTFCCGKTANLMRKNRTIEQLWDLRDVFEMKKN